MRDEVKLSQRNRDAAFFDMVHELVRDNKLLQDKITAAKACDRRREKRMPFPYVQLLAPFDGENLPLQSEFRHVQCCDISTRGFSYFDSPLPNYRHVVILFGKIPFRIFTAEVQRVQPTATPDVYIIGCRIASRLNK